MRKISDKVYYSVSGSPLKQTFVAVELPNGNFNLVEDQIIDIQEEIDSHAESCSIEHIIALCASGDTSALNKRQGSFIDTTTLPKTYRDVLEVVMKGQAEFNQLPLEIRGQFENNFVKWFEDAGSPDWLKKMKLVKDEPEKVSDGNAES